MRGPALGLTDRPKLAAWLVEAFTLLPDWNLELSTSCERQAVGTAVLDRGFGAVLVDLRGGEALALCQDLARGYPLLRLVAVSCCSHEHEEVLLQLLQLGLSGYLACDQPAEHLAWEVGRVLQGTPVWPADFMTRLLPQLTSRPAFRKGRRAGPPERERTGGQGDCGGGRTESPHGAPPFGRDPPSE